MCLEFLAFDPQCNLFSGKCHHMWGGDDSLNVAVICLLLMAKGVERSFTKFLATRISWLEKRLFALLPA